MRFVELEVAITQFLLHVHLIANAAATLAVPRTEAQAVRGLPSR